MHFRDLTLLFVHLPTSRIVISASSIVLSTLGRNSSHGISTDRTSLVSTLNPLLYTVDMEEVLVPATCCEDVIQRSDLLMADSTLLADLFCCWRSRCSLHGTIDAGSVCCLTSGQGMTKGLNAESIESAWMILLWFEENHMREKRQANQGVGYLCTYWICRVMLYLCMLFALYQRLFAMRLDLRISVSQHKSDFSRASKGSYKQASLENSSLRNFQLFELGSL